MKKIIDENKNIKELLFTLEGGFCVKNKKDIRSHICNYIRTKKSIPSSIIINKNTFKKIFENDIEANRLYAGIKIIEDDDAPDDYIKL